MQFEEYLMSESFDITSKPLKMTKPNMKAYLEKYLFQEYKEETEDIISEVYSSYSNVEVFKLDSGSEEYIVFLLTKGNKTEVHFNNFKFVDFYGKTKAEKVPLSLLSKIFNIIYWYCIKDGDIISLVHPDESRLNLYKTIVNKIIDKHNLKYMLVNRGDELLLEPISDKGFFEKFLDKGNYERR